MPRSTVSAPLIAFWLVLAVGAAGCGGRAARPEQMPTRSRERSVSFVARDEIAATAARNAEDLLQRLRPQMLLARVAHGSGSGTSATPTVYVDEVREGGIEVLQLVPARSIVDVTYLRAVEADRRFVGRHPAGAIVIRTRRTTPR
jgi:hypothetical protein